MDDRKITILAQFALDADSTKISQEFWEAAGATPQECAEVSGLISVILLGYALADTETQEIIEIIGESNIDVDAQLYQIILNSFEDRQKKSNIYSSADDEVGS